MALIVETGSGVSGAESYISVADADTFLKSELGYDSWTEATTHDKERALRMATRLIDAWWTFTGTKNVYTNALEWPRSYAIKTTDATTGLIYYLTTEIPQTLKNAVCRFAAYLIDNPRFLADLDERGVASSTTDAGSKAYRFQRQIESLPLPVRLDLAPLGTGPEIPVRRVA